MGILVLPIEILIAVVKELQPLDHFSLALACRKLECLIRDDAICQYSLKVGWFAPEYDWRVQS